MTLKEMLVTRAADTGGRLRVRSALNPMLWLCGIITIPAMIAAARLGSAAPGWLVMLAVAPVLAALLGFLFLLIFDRDKLQSEDYQLRKISLEMMQAKGDPAPILAGSIPVIAVPEVHELAEGAPEQGQ